MLDKLIQAKTLANYQHRLSRLVVVAEKAEDHRNAVVNIAGRQVLDRLKADSLGYMIGLLTKRDYWLRVDKNIDYLIGQLRLAGVTS